MSACRRGKPNADQNCVVEAKSRAVRFVASFHVRTPEEILHELGASRGGLSKEEALRRLELHHHNRIETLRQETLLPKFVAQFTHMMAVLLWIAAAIAFVAGIPRLGFVICGLNLINGLFSFWQEYKAEKALQALRRLLPQVAEVVRDGMRQRIDAETLVPGDLLVLNEGDHISADARVIDCTQLRVDQSSLSGESRPVRKTAEAQADSEHAISEFSNIVFAGTNVTAGNGLAVVFATGMHTEFGKIARLTQTLREEPSPLEQELTHATRVVSYVALAAGFLFFVIAAALGTLPLSQSFFFALGMIVAFIPEGLPPALTLALALGAQRMAKRNTLIKRLSAVETLGCTTVICSDKTGTLTRNEMTVRALWTPEDSYELTGSGYSPAGRLLLHGEEVVETPKGVTQLLHAAVLCNNARLAPPDTLSQSWSVLGDPTEAAMLVAARKVGMHYESESRQYPRTGEIAFDSHRKRMTTVHGSLACVKGAPHEVISLCTRIHEGTERAMRGEDRERAALASDSLAAQGLRVLAVAKRTLPSGMRDHSSKAVECDLTFLGLLAMADPPRDGVLEAVGKCHRAGIRMIMLTGDYGITGSAIARQIGLAKEPAVLNGYDLQSMPEEELTSRLSEDVVVARATPEDKLRVVRALQNMGHIVAVTGDGVNDAPALKRANIGVAMGARGADVARESADIILLDDNFATIVDAVEEGRAVYANLRKFITYICTSNAPEAAPFLFYAFSGGRVPIALNVMQILSIDLGTDMAPALALGAEPPEPGIMDRPPRRLDEHLFNRRMLTRAYLLLGIPQSILAMLAFYWVYWRNGYAGRWVDLPAEGVLHAQACSLTLAAVIATQIGNLFAQRTEHTSIFRVGLSGNPLIGWGIVSEFAVLFLLLYVPWLRNAFGTLPIKAADFGLLAAMMPALLIVDEIRKAVARYIRTR
ncbi:MAG: cation-transporting P-type ATPase [Bryobacterales bacterium]|nr:cation-transporting P-type ATPase [Bryobacterales bacterium]